MGWRWIGHVYDVKIEKASVKVDLAYRKESPAILDSRMISLRLISRRWGGQRLWDLGRYAGMGIEAQRSLRWLDRRLDLHEDWLRSVLYREWNRVGVGLFWLRRGWVVS